MQDSPCGNNGPKISVIITAYNSEEYIIESLQSVADQTFTDYEIIVVDDGSTDNTRQIVHISGIDCKYIHQENRGAAAARNRGLAAAKGELINFLDADDLLLPDKLSLQSAYLNQQQDVSVVYGDSIYFYQDGSGRSERYFSHDLRTPPYPKSGNMLEVLVINSVFAVHAGLVRQRCLIDIGGFDESLRSAEDYDLWLRMAEKYRFAYLDTPVVKYRIHGKNKIFTNPEHRLESLDKIWAKLVKSDKFLELPNHIQAQYYVRIATHYVLQNRAQSARIALRNAALCDPKNTTARLMLTALTAGARPLKNIIQLRQRIIRAKRRWK